MFKEGSAVVVKYDYDAYYNRSNSPFPVKVVKSGDVVIVKGTEGDNVLVSHQNSSVVTPIPADYLTEQS